MPSSRLQARRGRSRSRSELDRGIRSGEVADARIGLEQFVRFFFGPDEDESRRRDNGVFAASSRTLVTATSAPSVTREST